MSNTIRSGTRENLFKNLIYLIASAAFLATGSCLPVPTVSRD
uniref:Uncharacterized protein n=1 Tax=Brassica oleracea TaxID=3712 RepID=A0A3P6GU28_BRAOL|nr:unnamed protein product [Brassica oleracea]